MTLIIVQRHHGVVILSNETRTKSPENIHFDMSSRNRLSYIITKFLYCGLVQERKIEKKNIVLGNLIIKYAKF